MRVALAGAGNIAARYAAAIAATEPLELAGATDPVAGRARALVDAHGGRAYASLDELLADPDVDTVVNLSPPQAHHAVSAAALDAGKHVHSEKPLALAHADAVDLVERARANGVRLSGAPATLLGEAQQTAWKLVRDGALGRIRAVYAEANWDRLENWHPDPRALYGVGPFVDVGIYPLTIVTAMFGPVRRVRAWQATLEPDRVLLDGTPFTPGAPDFVVAIAELADGVTARFTSSFYVGPSKQRGLELHGDEGSLYMPTCDVADARIELKTRRTEYELVPPLREPYPGIDWASALVDLAQALEEDRPHRMSGEHAAHVVEVLEGAAVSAAGDGRSVAVRSELPRPEPLEWAA